jgi:hypothetical protein
VAGVVTGRALDTQGRPMARALIWFQPVSFFGVVSGRTGADGRYELQGLGGTPYYAKAWAEVAYSGRTYCVRLGMPSEADYDAFVPAPGAVRDFRWRLEGRIPNEEGERYFGGEVRLFGDGTTARGDSVELRLTPTGPLIDGSAGRALTRTVDAYGIARDIPVGPYRVTATLIAAGGARSPLRIGADDKTLDEAAPLEFLPSSSSCDATNGYGRSFLTWKRP